MYKVDSSQAEEFIHHEEILETLEYARNHKDNRAFIEQLIEKAALCKGLTHREAATLLEVLRQPHCHVRATLLVKLLRERLCVLPVSRKEQNNRPQKTDTGRNSQRSNRLAGYGA